MHELSLATDVIELVQQEAGKHGNPIIEEILIEIGDLSGVEEEIFLSALQILVKDTLLENTLIKINRTPGKGRCSSCNLEFEMKTLFDQCPNCKGFTSEIIDGQEFRVVSLVTA